MSQTARRLKAPISILIKFSFIYLYSFVGMWARWCDAMRCTHTHTSQPCIHRCICLCQQDVSDIKWFHSGDLVFSCKVPGVRSSPFASSTNENYHVDAGTLHTHANQPLHTRCELIMMVTWPTTMNKWIFQFEHESTAKAQSEKRKKVINRKRGGQYCRGVLLLARGVSWKAR